jgi:hypothetical protein
MLLDSDWTVRKWLANDVFTIAGQTVEPTPPPAPNQEPKPQEPQKSTKGKRTEL